MCFVFLIAPIRATNARSFFLPFFRFLLLFFFIRNLLAAWAWRENQFFFLQRFFTLSSVKFPRQTDNTDGSFRQKPRTSKSEKRWSFPFTEGHFKFFFCLLFTLTRSLFLSHALIRSYSFFHYVFFSLSLFRTSVSTFRIPRKFIFATDIFRINSKNILFIYSDVDQMRTSILTLKGNTSR